MPVKNYIVLHHSATKDGAVRDFDAILREHLARGYKDIGYHYVIEKVNGKYIVIPGRAEHDVGAHCINRNVDGIGICLVGNYEIDTPTEMQYKIIADLCKDIMSRHPIKEIGRHRDYNATACPGKNFNIERVKQLIREGDTVKDIKVTIKGKEITGKLIDNVTYVPVRELLEKLNYKLVWDDESKSVNIK